MPISPAHEWHEGETWVSVDVKIRAVTPSSANIMMTDCYAKVNCAPYFFEADLYGEIDCRKSSASVGQDTIKFFFIKKEQGRWGRLNLPGDRQMILDRRHRSLAAIREQAHKDRQDIPVKLSNIGRLAVGEQSKLEEAKRKAIERKKQEELRIEQERLKSWMAESSARQSITNAHMRNMSDLKCPEAYDEEMVGTSTESKIREDVRLVRECHQLERSCTLGPDESFKKPRDDFRGLPTTCLPAPRRCSSLPVTFSSKPDRPVHLPARESRDRVHLKKQQTTNADASNPTEREPLFLQDKGDKFFKSGDFQSAINAYTSALDVEPSSLANRAACKLQLEQYEDCVRDCCKVADLLKEVTPMRDHTTTPHAGFLHSERTERPGEQIQVTAEDCQGHQVEQVPVRAEDCTGNPTGQIQLSSLTLSTCLKERGVDEDSVLWEAGVKKHVLLLNATAKYREGKLSEALEIYTEALRFEPAHKELEHVVMTINRQLTCGTP